MYDTPKDLIDALRASPVLLNALLEDCTPETARLGSGSPDDWSVIEIVCHMRDATGRALERMRQMRDEENPVIVSYDQEGWVKERNYASADLSEARDAFARFCEQHAAELASLSPVQWKRKARHAELGEIDILTHTIHVVSHDMIHMAQLARKRGAHAV
jgi:hypothetical protein